MKSTRVLGAIAAGSLLFAACSGGSASDSATESTAVGAAAPAAAEVAAADPATEAPSGDAATDADAATVEAAPAALQFSAPLVGGGEIDASTLAGKPTVFWFWAPT
jgi:hypothetical protein